MRISGMSEDRAMREEILDRVRAIVDETKPGSALVIGGDIGSALRDYRARCPACTIQSLPFSALPRGLDELGHFDLAIVHGVLERLDKQTAAHLLARLRDVHAGHVVVVVPMGEGWPDLKTHWEPREFFAFGLVLAGKFGQPPHHTHVYRFDIDSYKSTPDWLNANNWAHPERWDKDWW